jgi:DNA adenine methylase
MGDRFWIVSYDNVAPIKELYSGFRNIVYSVGYTARENRIGKEAMFFGPKLTIPGLVGPIKQLGKITDAAYTNRPKI